MLRKGRIFKNRDEGHEEIAPMESIVNLVDAMLVFICGLLVAIFTYWNIDAGNLVEVMNQNQLKKVDNPEEIQNNINSYESMDSIGSAILDPKTGDIYVLDDGGEEDGGTPSSGEQTGSSEGSTGNAGA